MPSLHRLFAVAPLLAGLSIAAAGPCSAGDPPALVVRSAASVLGLLRSEDGVLWMNKERTEPMFVPERLFAGQLSLDDLPIGEEGIRRLHSMLARPHEGDPSPQQDCSNRQLPGLGRIRNDAYPFAERVRKAPLVFTGEVTALETGLYLWSPESAATVVRVTVGEVIRDDDDYSATGKQLRFPILGGSLHIQGAELCVWDPYSVPFRPKVGQRLLVLGLAWNLDRRVVNGAIAYPLNSDRMIDIGYTGLQVSGPITLTDIRALAREGQDAH